MKTNSVREPSAEIEEVSAKRNKRKIVLAVVSVFTALALVAVGWVGGYFSVDRRARSIAKMVDTVAENYYLDVDKNELYNSLYDTFELDRFCTHYTKEEYEGVLAEGKGNNAGYGISLYSAEEPTRVYRTVGNSPAERAGVERGMYITEFGESESSLRAGDMDETLAFLREKSECVLAVGYEKDGSDAKIVSISREDYLGSYCEYADNGGTYRFRTEENQLVLTRVGDGMELPAGDAYIRIAQFEGKVAEEFQACLEKMKENGKTNLTIDLRSNGGGYLTSMCEMLSHLLKEADGKRPIVATAPDYGRGETYRANGNDFSDYFTESSRIRVLADENSASASEAFIGAMLSYKTISPADIFIRVGEDGKAHTYGKGVMQAHFTAQDGNVVRLTVSRILWPDGTCIHGTGIVAEGKNAVTSPLLPSARDEFLEAVF